jgi:hypothetical protein
MRRAMWISTLLLLAVPSLATAKGLESGRACGASGCRTTAFHDRFPDSFVLPPMLSSGTFSSARPEAAPWYRLRFALTGVGPEGELTGALLADASYVGGRDEPGEELVWQRTSPAEAAFYRDFTRGLEPYPAQRLPGLHRDEQSDSSDDSTELASSSTTPPAPQSEHAGGSRSWKLLSAIVAAIVAAALLGALGVRMRQVRGRGPWRATRP